MRTIHKIVLFLFIGMLSIESLKAQGALCSDIEPFCAGEERLTFPNSNFTNSSQISGEPGIDYGCLEEQPYPAWFFLQVEDSGDLTFRISQFENEDGTGAPLDVDFIVWGPFERGEDYCSGAELNAGSIVDCSYLPDAIETMTIPGAMANEIYVVVITNFQQLPGYISLEQTNSGEGSTDCSILDSDLGDNIIVCDEDEYVLDGTTDEAEVYEWYVYDEATAGYEQIPGEDGPTLTVTQSGDYRLVVRDLVGASEDQDDVTVTFYDNPLIGEVSNLSACEEGSDFIDLTENEQELISPNADASAYEAVYFESEDDIENEIAISQPQNYNFQAGKIIYARVRNIESGCYSTTETFELTTFDFAEYTLPDNTIFCVEPDGRLLNVVSIGEDLGDEYNYEWTDGTTVLGTDPVLTLNSLPMGDEIVLRLTHAASGCEIQLRTIPVSVSRPENVLIEISGSDFGDGYTVTAIPQGVTGESFAIFEYQLDNNGWQDNNVFTDVPPGNHVISVREINGCGITSSESFFLIGYPRFFTPNSDGYNDTWNLINNGTINIKSLYVFDRYGKLIKQLNPNTQEGWDGNYNGKAMPADDYWFRVEFVDETTGDLQEYMANFTLIR